MGIATLTSRQEARWRRVMHGASATARGRLPARYARPWREEFDARMLPALRPGTTILDVGSGCRPTLDRAQLPSGCTYVGLDLSEEELRKAPAGSYDELVTADATHALPHLRERFDLVLSYQVLEHVKPLERAFANFHSYLRPGGWLVTEFSGTFSLFGMVNRALPHRLSKLLLPRLFDRPAASIFPAHYHRCYQSALEDILRSWSSYEITPRYRGAGYFAFLRPVQAGYIAYEEWVRLSGHRNLAPYYIVSAQK